MVYLISRYAKMSAEKDKKKGIKLFVLFFLVIGLFEVTLFSSITSRIEGVVSDIDTGAVIIGAEVQLIPITSLTVRDPKIKTFNDGMFRFDDLRQGQYYISIYKKGYAYYGPDYIFMNKGIYRLPKRTRLSKVGVNFSSDTECITIKEGEIKHLKITLRKEAILEIHYTRITSSGSEPLMSEYGPEYDIPVLFKNFSATLFLEKPSSSVLRPTNKSIGKAMFENLHGDQTVKVKVFAEGYPATTYEVNLEYGEKTIIEHVLDFTKAPVIHGFLKEKSTGKPYKGSSISITDSNNKWVRIYTDKNGEFWLGGFTPGRIEISIFFQSGIRACEREEFYLKIEANEIRELNLEY